MRTAFIEFAMSARVSSSVPSRSKSIALNIVFLKSELRDKKFLATEFTENSKILTTNYTN